MKNANVWILLSGLTAVVIRMAIGMKAMARMKYRYGASLSKFTVKIMGLEV